MSIFTSIASGLGLTSGVATEATIIAATTAANAYNGTDISGNTGKVIAAIKAEAIAVKEAAVEGHTTGRGRVRAAHIKATMMRNAEQQAQQEPKRLYMA